MTRPEKLKRDPWAKLVSQLPWDDEGDEVFIYDADGVPVATTDKAWLPYDVRIANNRFIIRACNVHDELLAVLKAWEAAIPKIDEFASVAPDSLRGRSLAIIAKCEGR